MILSVLDLVRGVVTESFEMWYWWRMGKICWTDRV